MCIEQNGIPEKTIYFQCNDGVVECEKKCAKMTCTHQINQVRTTAHTAATAADTTDTFCSEVAACLDEAVAIAELEDGDAQAATIVFGKDFGFAILELSEGVVEATCTASALMSEQFRIAAAAEAAHSDDKGAEASFSRHLQAICTVSSCFQAKEGEMTQDSTEITPLLMKIDATRPETSASKRQVRL
jgi:hypothetical protein